MLKREFIRPEEAGDWQVSATEFARISISFTIQGDNAGKVMVAPQDYISGVASRGALRGWNRKIGDYTKNLGVEEGKLDSIARQLKVNIDNAQFSSLNEHYPPFAVLKKLVGNSAQATEELLDIYKKINNHISEMQKMPTKDFIKELKSSMDSSAAIAEAYIKKEEGKGNNIFLRALNGRPQADIDKILKTALNKIRGSEGFLDKDELIQKLLDEIKQREAEREKIATIPLRVARSEITYTDAKTIDGKPANGKNQIQFIEGVDTAGRPVYEVVIGEERKEIPAGMAYAIEQAVTDEIIQKGSGKVYKTFSKSIDADGNKSTSAVVNGLEALVNKSTNLQFAQWQPSTKQRSL